MTTQTTNTAMGLLMSGLLLAGGCNRPDPMPVDTQTADPMAQMDQQRNDTTISTEIRARFYGDDLVRGHGIDVKVDAGMVALEGEVQDDRVRKQAVALAQGVEGVEGVDNRIEVTAPVADRGVVGEATPPADGRRDTAAPAVTRTASNDVNAAWITMKIQSQFFLDDDVNGLDIDVTTTDTGVVTLEGAVESQSERARAAAIAQGTEGVRSVTNDLRVEATPAATTASRDGVARPAPDTADATDLDDVPISDGWVTMKIQSKYFLDDEVAGRHINVDTQEGAVTLRGEVEDEAERRQAVALARTTDGVRSVDDQLRIVAARETAANDTPDADADRSAVQVVDDAWVTTKIQSKYFLDEDVKGLNVDVDTRDGVVTLTGAVASDVARQSAEAIARGTDGVSQVVNQLRIDPASGDDQVTDEEPATRDIPRD